MTTYLDVGVVRIQQYLAHTNNLWGRRGASAIIRTATSKHTPIDGTANAGILGHDANESPAEIDPIDGIVKVLAESQHHWKRNCDAGDIDGVVSLVSAGQPLEGEIEAVGEIVMGTLRESLPGAQFEAKWASLDSEDANYSKAKAAMEGNRHWVSLPSLSDFPGLRPCTGCGHRMITARKEYLDTASEEKLGQFCSDCALRENHAGRQRELRPRVGWPSGPVAASFSAEADLLLAIRANGYPDLETVNHFADLAESRAGGTRSNHLATIMIDGNSIGEFFRRISSGEGQSVRDASLRLARLTRNALTTATLAVMQSESRDGDASEAVRPSSKLPVVPHLVGGDDVLVTVPAGMAWQFARAFLDAFAEVGKSPDNRLGVTASAAIVFAKHNAPFSESVEIADRVLGEAKRKALGKASAIAWIDLTRDRGEESHTPYTATEIDANERAFAWSHCLGEAARESLLRMTRLDKADVAVNRIRADCDRNGWDPDRHLENRLLAAGEDTAEGLRQVRDLLEIGRWGR